MCEATSLSTSWSKRSSMLWISPSLPFLRAHPRYPVRLSPPEAADPSDPISSTVDRDGISSLAFPYTAERIFMRHHDMWVFVFGPGTG